MLKTSCRLPAGKWRRKLANHSLPSWGFAGISRAFRLFYLLTCLGSFKRGHLTKYEIDCERVYNSAWKTADAGWRIMLQLNWKNARQLLMQTQNMNKPTIKLAYFVAQLVILCYNTEKYEARALWYIISWRFLFKMQTPKHACRNAQSDGWTLIRAFKFKAFIYIKEVPKMVIYKKNDFLSYMNDVA